MVFMLLPEHLDFDSLAVDYDQNAILAQESAAILVERLLCFKALPERVLDLGCGTGFVTRLLLDLSASMHIDALDCSSKMLDRIPKSERVSPIHGRAQAIPTVDSSYDAVLANCLLPWCSAWPQVFQEAKRVLKPGGLFLISTLAPDCWLGNPDAITSFSCWRDCPTMEQMADALNAAQFSDVVADTMSLAFEFEDGGHIQQAFLSSGCLVSVPTPAMSQNCFDINLTLIHAIKPLANQLQHSGEFYVPIESLKKKSS